MRIHFSIIFLYFVLSAMVFLPDKIFCQLTPISLDQRIDKANIIFEGKVISKTSFWDNAHLQIYTSNIIRVYKVFKGGSTSSEVEIITPGGTVGKDMELVSHSLQLNIGDIGIFTAIPSPVSLPRTSGLLRLKAYSGKQGFIKYDVGSHTARDPFATYKSIQADVYIPIMHRTKSSILTIQKADFTIQ